MNLSERAAQASQRSRDAAAAQTASKLTAEGTLIAERVGDLLGLPTTYLDSSEGYHPVERRNRGGFGTYVSRDRHKVHRILVDDVTFWWLMPTNASHNPLDGDLVVERPCRNCGRRHFARIEDLDGPKGYDALLTPESAPSLTGVTQESVRKRYEESRSEKARARYELAIGATLNAEPLCWDCRIGIPQTCPTCGRSDITR